MPDYDYRCERCECEFTVHSSIAEHDQQTKKHDVHCPKCGSTDVRHLIESIYVTTSKKS
jgi:putative FmdB family regulatory protein